jgi:hypothetical protein
MRTRFFPLDAFDDRDDVLAGDLVVPVGQCAEFGASFSASGEVAGISSTSSSTCPGPADADDQDDEGFGGYGEGEERVHQPSGAQTIAGSPRGLSAVMMVRSVEV